MARAPKRLAPKYVKFNHEGSEFVLDLANREVLKNWVAVERQIHPEIFAAYERLDPQLVTA
jgi:hypothetical protein